MYYVILLAAHSGETTAYGPVSDESKAVVIMETLMRYALDAESTLKEKTDTRIVLTAHDDEQLEDVIQLFDPSNPVSVEETMELMCDFVEKED